MGEMNKMTSPTNSTTEIAIIKIVFLSLPLFIVCLEKNKFTAMERAIAYVISALCYNFYL